MSDSSSTSAEPREPCEQEKICEKYRVDKDKTWGNQIQFILSAIGLAVGLGNVWRFPFLAYENGGAAFLIPYIICDVLFGLPVIYSEFLIGQYTQTGPAKAFYRYAPAFHGLGFFTTSMAFLVGAFYAVVIGWAMLYLVFTVIAKSDTWVRCDNWWNTANCISSLANVACRQANASLPFASFNSTCVAEHPENVINGAAEFFTYYVAPKSTSILDFNQLNWPVTVCLVVLYVLCAATNIKGIEILGKISYVTVPLPYIVVLILFGRGVTLDGAWDGIQHYLFKPDVSKLLSHQTWAAALNQACFSLTMGMGALVSLSSHNKQRNNCLRDAFLVIVFDTLMSVIGGLAVFSTLGYLAKQTSKEISDVVKGGPALVFVVYPEAIATMPIPWLWNLLFFVMIFLLGFSSEVAIIETACLFIHNTFPQIKRKWIMPIVVSTILCAVGSVMTTDAGWYWFGLMADFTASTGPCIALALQLILLAYVYGWFNVVRDLESLFGPKPKSLLRLMFSKYSPFFGMSWAFICPILALVVGGFTLKRQQIPLKIDDYVLPIWAEVLGWFLNLGPFLAVPICFFVQLFIFKRRGLSLRYLFRPTKLHPSHDRFYRFYGIEPADGFNEEEPEENEAEPSPVKSKKKKASTVSV